MKIFNLPGRLQLLDTQENPFIPSRAEDIRLVAVGQRIYVVYSDNKNEICTNGGFRMYVAELEFDGDRFTLNNNECLSRFEGEKQWRREKNWCHSITMAN